MANRKHADSARKTKRLVFCAILSALSFVLSMLGTLLGVFDLTGIIFSGLLVALVMIELSPRWAILVWLVTSALLALFLPDKFVAIEYIVFAGIYPAIKNGLERLPKILSWILKFVYFNLVLTGLILLATKVQLFMAADTDLSLSWLVYLLGNAFFLVYDLCMGVYVRFYELVLRKRLRISRFIS